MNQLLRGKTKRRIYSYGTYQSDEVVKDAERRRETAHRYVYPHRKEHLLEDSRKTHEV